LISPVGTPEGVRPCSPFQDCRTSRDKTSSSCDSGRFKYIKTFSRECRVAEPLYLPWNEQRQLRTTVVNCKVPMVSSSNSLRY
jgi:hypothetical protein